MSWALAEAKNRFSEVARLALASGPQEITRRGEKLVLLSEKDYLKLVSHHIEFKNFLLQETPELSDLDLRRDTSSMRSVKL